MNTGRSRRAENGIALISVMSVLALSMLVAAAIVATSQALRFRTATQTRLGESVYQCESVANLAVWLLMSDRAGHPNRSLGGGDDVLSSDERFLADGRKHRAAGDEEYSFQIFDFYSGVVLAGAAPGAALNFLNEALALAPDRREKLDILRNRLLDYADPDDNLRLRGMERFDYLAAGLAPLPRNGPLQYREEVLWLPGSEEFINPDADGVLRYVSPIPLRGMPQTPRGPSLFSAPMSLIKDKANLDDQETIQVEAALERVRTENIKLEEAFLHRDELLARLKKSFTTVESGYYTILIRPGRDSRGGRTLQISLRVDSSPPQKFTFLQWQFL